MWVGEGASTAAGYPSSAELAAAIREDSDAEIPEGLDLPEVADAYIAANGSGPLVRLLYERVGRIVRKPTPFHHAVARLAEAKNSFAAIITTNFDRLIERALEQARQGREFILGEMNRAIAEPRPDISPFAPKITMIKIDVDGNEARILRGMRDLLSGDDRPRLVSVEVNRREKPGVFAFMEEQGYAFSERNDTMGGLRKINAGADPEDVAYNAIFRPAGSGGAAP